MKEPILKDLTHRGTVAAEGFWLSARLLPETEMRRRALALWRSDSRLYRQGSDLIVVFAEPRRVDCRRAPGLPLVRCGALLASFPLSRADAAHFGGTGAAFVLMRAGRFEAFKLDELTPEHPERWFETADFRVVGTATLGLIRSKPVVAAPPPAVDLREELPAVPPADAELAEILRSLKEKREELEKSKAGGVFSEGGRAGSFGAAAAGLAAGLVAGAAGGILSALGNIFSGMGGAGYQSLSGTGEPPPPGPLRQALTRLLFRLRIGQLLGRRQARYLARMIEMFENGELDEALRHAIPLTDLESLKDAGGVFPFLGLLRPRDRLRIDYGRRTAGSSVILEDQWFESLRRLYRQTFDRLVAQGRFEEAAFVLAELLRNNAEAVEFLEKHGKLRLAAELAEARGLPPETIVRQWFLAGEKRRAVQLAIRHRCFEYVVARLEQEKHPRAAELREIWARALAEAGHFAAAVNTVWPLGDRRALAVEWIDRVIEFGGPAGAEMLAKKVVLLPESFDAAKGALLEMLSADDADAIEKRAAFAREALRLVPNRELRVLARPLARKLLADLAAGRPYFAVGSFSTLVELAQDYALRADLPKLPAAAGAPASEKVTLEIPAHDTGASAVYDACPLPGGKIALALGEAGVKILSKTDRTIAHFDQPAYRFVVSDSGTKALCLAPRGETFRLARIDFAARVAKYWCEARIETCAPGFDGDLWFVATGDEVHAIDANAADFESVWRVSEIGGRVHEIARSPSKMVLTIFRAKGAEKWWYDLPALVLRSRNEQAWSALADEDRSIHSVGSFLSHSVVQLAELAPEDLRFEARVFDYAAEIATIPFPAGTLTVEPPKIIEKIFVLASRRANAQQVVGLYEERGKKLAAFRLDGAGTVNLRLDEKYLTVTDSAGRVVVFDHRDRILCRNLRV